MNLNLAAFSLALALFVATSGALANENSVSEGEKVVKTQSAIAATCSVQKIEADSNLREIGPKSLLLQSVLIPLPTLPRCDQSLKSDYQKAAEPFRFPVADVSKSEQFDLTSKTRSILECRPSPLAPVGDFGPSF